VGNRSMRASGCPFLGSLFPNIEAAHNDLVVEIKAGVENRLQIEVFSR
jgi:hypothetical protein